MSRIGWAPLSAIIVAAAAGAAFADVVTDGTTGPRLRLDGPEFAIGAELGTRAGQNLFHSFERFHLDAGERATFSGPDAIRNVISRVTGGERSAILIVDVPETVQLERELLLGRTTLPDGESQGLAGRG